MERGWRDMAVGDGGGNTLNKAARLAHLPGGGINTERRGSQPLFCCVLAGGL